jgi:DNA-directed RNA polymerase specialized sigma24 family protein
LNGSAKEVTSMCAYARHLSPCDAFLEARAAKIKEIVLWVLKDGNCTDTPNHTPEVVNDIYIKVRGAWSALRSPEHAINTITKNTARTHAAKCRREIAQILDDDIVPLLATQALDPTALLEQAILLEELLSQLDPLDQTILDLLFRGYEYTDIAVMLRMECGTLRSRYSRAVQRLRLVNVLLASPHP